MLSIMVQLANLTYIYNRETMKMNLVIGLKESARKSNRDESRASISTPFRSFSYIFTSKESYSFNPRLKRRSRGFRFA